MKNIQFEALSTNWKISCDQGIPNTLQNAIIKLTQDFEQKYSRFIPTSIVSQVNQGKADPTLDTQLVEMLRFAKKLETESNGGFTVHVGKTLSRLGYGTGSQDIDLGGFGKGWLIDLVAAEIVSQGVKHFCINAGGDIFATTKKNGEAWTVGLEHPVQRRIALGTTQLSNSSLAVSAPGDRTWNDHHHLIDTTKNTSATWHRAVYVRAKTATVADGVATTLYVTQEEKWAAVAQAFKCEYLILNGAEIHQSKQFDATLFLNAQKKYKQTIKS